MLQVLGLDAHHSLCVQHDGRKEAGKQQASKTRALVTFPGGSCKYYQQKSTRGSAKHHGHFPHTSLDHAGCDTPVSHLPWIYLMGRVGCWPQCAAQVAYLSCQGYHPSFPNAVVLVVITEAQDDSCLQATDN